MFNQNNFFLSVLCSPVVCWYACVLKFYPQYAWVQETDNAVYPLIKKICPKSANVLLGSKVHSCQVEFYTGNKYGPSNIASS